MKALLINGSPHQHGCTYTALSEAAKAMNAEGVETEILWIGSGAVRGCIGCRACAKNDRRCVFTDDRVNEALDKMTACDALIVGSPVHYASAGGSITAFMDRMFYCGGRTMSGKVGGCVVSARRGGTTAALDQLQKYFIICGMPLAPSQYWPMVHGNTPEEVAKDEEGLQTMRTLGRNAAWMIKSFALAREQGILPPAPEKERKVTNFIR